MAARSSLLRRPTPGARPARRTSSVVAALAALAPRLVRLAHHDYSDRLLVWCPRGGLSRERRAGSRGGGASTPAAGPGSTLAVKPPRGHHTSVPDPKSVANVGGGSPALARRDDEESL